jgi:hypothetical protein
MYQSIREMNPVFHPETIQGTRRTEPVAGGAPACRGHDRMDSTAGSASSAVFWRLRLSFPAVDLSSCPPTRRLPLDAENFSLKSTARGTGQRLRASTAGFGSAGGTAGFLYRSDVHLLDYQGWSRRRSLLGRSKLTFAGRADTLRRTEIPKLPGSLQ